LRVLLVIPGLVLLFAGVCCVLGKNVSVIQLAFVPSWVGALGCVAGLCVIVYGAGRRKF
jgi:hypothetical protein